MSATAWIGGLLPVAVVLGVAAPLGAWLNGALDGRPRGLSRLLVPLERLICRLARIDPAREMTARGYALAFLAFHLVGFIVLLLLQRLQGILPLNPADVPAVPLDTAVNAAISFVTNTNWQSYAGEAAMSPLTQMLGFTVQNFVSAAAGLAVLLAIARGFTRREATTVGNFHVDLVRATVHVLLPLSFVFALAYAAEGVVQTLGAQTTIDAPLSRGAAGPPSEISIGPVASQLAIKELGTNGGGYFNANSAHPFENPTPTTNFLQLVAILLVPAALCFSFGRRLGAPREGAALLAAMVLIFVPAVVLTTLAELDPGPALVHPDVDPTSSGTCPGGQLEGKELRFGIAGSTVFAAATTAASNGSVNSLHDSYTALGGLVPMLLIQLGEVVFGGVGSGLYGMIAFALVAVFVAGLMIGRTPVYLGKRIEAFEMKMVAIVVLAPCLAVLAGTALSVSGEVGTRSILNPGPHGFSEVLYAWSSAGNNNGSAFAGLGADTPFYNLGLGVAMLIGRFAPALGMIGIAGALAGKRSIPTGAGSLRTDTPLFVFLLVLVVLLVGALTFVPALVLGPIAEHLGARS